jgi:hypothetical protein
MFASPLDGGSPKAADALISDTHLPQEPSRISFPSEGGEESDDEDFAGQELTCKWMSPFEVHFSQRRARHEFRDGRSLAEAVDLITAVRCGEAGSPQWRLEAPFPPITILPWRCKLRNEHTGRPLVDPKSGGELYDSVDRFFSLDNRRLYCLQLAASKLWPEPVVIETRELPPGPLRRVRELKKFRTLDRGRSVYIGGRNEGETLVYWSWRQKVGLQEEVEVEPDADNSLVQMRRRPRPEHRSAQTRAPRSARNKVTAQKHGDSLGGKCLWWDYLPGGNPWTGILLFICVYSGIRLTAKLVSSGFTAYSGTERRVDDAAWRGDLWFLLLCAVLVGTCLVGVAASPHDDQGAATHLTERVEHS